MSVDWLLLVVTDEMTEMSEVAGEWWLVSVFNVSSTTLCLWLCAVRLTADSEFFRVSLCLARSTTAPAREQWEGVLLLVVLYYTTCTVCCTSSTLYTGLVVLLLCLQFMWYSGSGTTDYYSITRDSVHSTTCFSVCCWLQQSAAVCFFNFYTISTNFSSKLEICL